MATTEQVDILLKTVGDTSGAQQVSQALTQTQQAASGVQNQLSAQQQFANTVLRQSMSQVPQTLAAFEAQKRAVEQQIGARPTLIPEDVGIKATQASTALRSTATATREVGEASRVTGNEIARMGLAFIGANVGLSAFSAIGQLAHQAMVSIVADTIAFSDAQRANTITLGQQSVAFQQWASTVSEQAGVTQRSLLEAGSAAQQFGRNLGFGPAQVTQLTAVATVLAQIRGQDVGQTMNLLTSALEGNAQAAQQLNLQLDAGYIAFNQLGGATADVFNQLDPATQATLRWQTALGQLSGQVATTSPQIDALREAQGKLNAEWEKFSNTTGPAAIGVLSGILGLANSILGLPDISKPITDIPQDVDNIKKAFQEVASGAASGVQDAQNAIQQLQDKLGPDSPLVAAAQIGLRGLLQAMPGGAVATSLGDLNQQLKDTTGADVFTTATDAVGTALDAVKDKATQAGSAVANVYSGAADQADRVAASAQAIAQHNQQIADIAAQVAPAQATLAAAQANEVTAVRALVDLKSDQLSLTADEARIKLAMLPTQERLVELQNATTQAQIRAQQATLPSSRAQQDLQDRIRLYTLIAQSPDRSLAERQQALASATALTRRTPETDIAALQAQIGARPAERAAEDVNTAARLQALQQAAILQPLEYQKQQNDLLTQIATAAKDAAQRTVELTIQAINVIVHGSGLGSLTDTDRQNIINLAGQAVLDAIDGAIKSVDKRGANSQLLAAGP